MTKLFDIPAAEVSKRLAQKGIDPEKPVTVLIDETLEDLAERMRTKAADRGMTPELFRELINADE